MWKVKDTKSLNIILEENPNFERFANCYRWNRDAWGSYIRIDLKTMMVTHAVSEGTVVGWFKRGLLH